MMHDSTELTMCWAGSCYPPSINISPNSQVITSGQTITDFVGHYTQTAFSHFSSGESVVRWVFFDKGNVNDSVSVTIKYTTFPLGVEDLSARQGMISNIYPNPATGYVSCNYSLPSGSVGSILIRNILGSSVQTQILPAESGKVTINTMNLNDGVYFYSLLIDGKISQTKKMIVKH